MTVVAGAIGAHNRRQVGVGIARGKRGVSHGANIPVAVGQTNGNLFGYFNISSDADLGKLRCQCLAVHGERSVCLIGYQLQGKLLAVLFQHTVTIVIGIAGISQDLLCLFHVEAVAGHTISIARRVGECGVGCLSGIVVDGAYIRIAIDTHANGLANRVILHGFALHVEVQHVGTSLIGLMQSVLGRIAQVSKLVVRNIHQRANLARL